MSSFATQKATTAVPKFLQPLYGFFTQRYQAAVNKKLASYGLRYDDLHNSTLDEDVAEALRRLPPQVVLARNARLRRALDLDTKKMYLTGELLAAQTPSESYLTETLRAVQEERRERAMLGAGPAFLRAYGSLPTPGADH